MEVYVFIICITALIAFMIFAGGVALGRNCSDNKEAFVEISDEADVLAADLRLMAAIGGLSSGEKSKLNKAADYIEKLGEIKIEGA